MFVYSFFDWFKFICVIYISSKMPTSSYCSYCSLVTVSIWLVNRFHKYFKFTVLIYSITTNLTLKIVHCSLVTGCFWLANRFNKYLPLILPNIVASRSIMITWVFLKINNFNEILREFFQARETQFSIQLRYLPLLLLLFFIQRTISHRSLPKKSR